MTSSEDPQDVGSTSTTRPVLAFALGSGARLSASIRGLPCGALPCRKCAARVHRPVPLNAVQILGVQVCAVPWQVHPGAGTNPAPMHAAHLPRAALPRS